MRPLFPPDIDSSVLTIDHHALSVIAWGYAGLASLPNVPSYALLEANLTAASAVACSAGAEHGARPLLNVPH
jgi:hypothetical protein